MAIKNKKTGKAVAKSSAKSSSKKPVKKAAVKSSSKPSKSSSKKPAPKKSVSKKPAPKKVAAKKPASKSAVKKPVKNKAPVKKVEIKKTATSKNATKAKAFTANVTAKNKVVAKSAPAKKAVASAPAKVIKAAPVKNTAAKARPTVTKSNITYMNNNPIKKATFKRIDIAENYKPTAKEEYMNNNQLEYFRRKLDTWKKELLQESTETIQHLQTESWNEPDPSDQATIVEQTGLELRTRDRYRKLIAKIDAALNRIDSGDYGYCEVTGDPIGIARLEARPIATMTIAAQEQHEMEEKLNMEG